MTLHFLSGLPRTGTTLLSCILNQNPLVYATSTSGLLDFLSGVDFVYNEIQKRSTDRNEKQVENIFRAIVSSYYSHIDCPVVIDKWRGWMNNIPQINDIISADPKIICTYRPIEEIVVSFLTLLEKDPNNFVDYELKKLGKEINNKNRSLYLWNEGVVGESYSFFETSLRYDCCLYLSYKNLIEEPKETLEKIYKYLHVDNYDHDFANINSSVTDDDQYWGIKNLHSIRNVIEYKSTPPEKYLDDSLLNYFKQYNRLFDHAQAQNSTRNL